MVLQTNNHEARRTLASNLAGWPLCGHCSDAPVVGTTQFAYRENE